MKYLKHAKAFLVTAAIICVCIRVIFWAIEPLLPYLLGGIILVTVIGMAIYRTTRF